MRRNRLKLAATMGFLSAALVATAAHAIPPSPPPPCGRVRDAITDTPIAGVEVSFLYRATLRSAAMAFHTVTDSTGTYCIRPDGAWRVVYQAAGYHDRILLWPEDLSPTGKRMPCGERFVDVLLVPLELP